MHDEITVITNNQPRPVIYGHELTEKQALEFDYMDNIEDGSFFKYKGHVYDLGDVMRINSSDCVPTAFKGYHGYVGESYFSGILVKISDCGEEVTIGRYCS